MGRAVLTMHGRTRPNLVGPLQQDLWRVSGVDDPPDLSAAVVIPDGTSVVPDGFGLYLGAVDRQPTLVLPDALRHLGPGDVIQVSSDGTRLTVLWKATARHNSLLLTEQCDNYCIMCSQPPRTRSDEWLYRRAERVVSLTPADAVEVTFTGGEPTLHGDQLIRLLLHCRDERPAMGIHLLSNGRRFADPAFARRYAQVDHPDLMVGIPLYAAEPSLHDFVVQARGAFAETVRGILNLAALGRRVELRVVIQRHNAEHLPMLADYICRNLPFVSQVALMGLEMTGLAQANAAEVWIDPDEYRDALRIAATRLCLGGVRTRIYNHQLCTIERPLWPIAVRSISDWKNTYAEVCEPCAVRERCGGVFSTSKSRVSKHLRPVLA